MNDSSTALRDMYHAQPQLCLELLIGCVGGADVVCTHAESMTHRRWCRLTP